MSDANENSKDASPAPAQAPTNGVNGETEYAARKVRELLAHARRLNRIEFDAVARLQGDAG
jgi:hypothetical protein